MVQNHILNDWVLSGTGIHVTDKYAFRKLHTHIQGAGLIPKEKSYHRILPTVGPLT